MQIQPGARLLLISFFCFLLVIPQEQRPGKEELFAEHRRAMAIYNTATAIGNSENYDEAKEKELNQNALDQFSLLLKKIPEGRSEFDSIRFHSCFTIGELHHFFEHYSQALTYYQKAIDIKKQSVLADSLLMRPYIYSGLIYYQQSKFNTASLFFNRADSIQQKYKKPIRESERLYNTLGVIHYETGNFRLAKFYFQKALDLLPGSSPYYTSLFTNYKINLAQIHFSLEEYEEANRIYQELLGFNINHNEINLNLGIINLNLGAAEKAISHFRKVERVNNPKLARLYNQMGKAFLNLNQLDSAAAYLNLALSFGQNLQDQPGYGLSVKTMGDLYLKLDSPLKAIQLYSEAIQNFYPAYNKKDTKDNPEVFSGVFSFTSLFSALVSKAEAAHVLYRKTREISWATEELEIYQSAFKLVGYVQKTYNSDEARLFIDHYKYEVHSKPIDIAFELYQKTKDKKYLESLYFIDQQNKSSVLALRQARSADNALKDTSLLRQEKEIKASITRNLLKASREKDVTQIAAYSKEIRDQEILLDRIQEQLYPEGPTPLIPSTTQLQKKLLDGVTAIVSFHLSDDRVTIINIKKAGLETVQADHVKSFQDDVRKYIQSLRDPSQKPEIEIGKQLHEILFGKISLKGISRLVIIPDDELNFLPFESLRNKDGNYLFEKYSIQYQYSTSVLKKEDVEFNNKETLVFAPFATNGYQKDSLQFSQLPYSLTEVEATRGRKFVGQTATRAAFLQQVGSFSVVHLATHAIAGEGPGNSYVVFARDSSAQDLLMSEEIYNLELKNTKLVILSACETGAGKLIRGEGVMSLSRAFTYAGCPNILTSFWKADDMSTAYLAKRVHFYLDEGFSIDRAMQEARRDFFKDPKIHPSYRHPYYWSHLVFIGNYEPEENYFWWWIGGSLFISIILMLLFLRRRHQAAKGGKGISLGNLSS